jgi:hypothetical protein
VGLAVPGDFKGGLAFTLLVASVTAGTVGAVLGDVRVGGQAMAQKRVGFVDKEHGATALVWP